MYILLNNSYYRIKKNCVSLIWYIKNEKKAARKISDSFLYWFLNQLSEKVTDTNLQLPVLVVIVKS